MIIRRYTAYSPDTGEIAASFSGDETHTQTNTPSGCLLVDGDYSPAIGYFSNGAFVEYTAAQATAKRGRPAYIAAWDNAAMHWVDRRASAQVEKDARTKRGVMLSESDWAALPDVPLPAQQRSDWAAYRQVLRDIPLQPGFPQNILWPAAPTA